jgi:uracil-DNA glycosylase family 4
VTDLWSALRREVIDCRSCPRLVRYREEVARTRKREFRDQEYWGRPVPGFGDPQARLLLVGLAPAAHGSNRTGRMFTGDRSAAFLVAALYEAGFANQPTSHHRGDGLHYTDLYLTAAVRCAPPENRPTSDERRACRGYLVREIQALSEVRAILALGAFAWEAARDAARLAYGRAVPEVPFRHGACQPLGSGLPHLWASYHPSPQNTQTGRLQRADLVDLLRRIRAGYSTDDIEGTPSAPVGRGSGRVIPPARSRPPG